MKGYSTEKKKNVSVLVEGKNRHVLGHDAVLDGRARLDDSTAHDNCSFDRCALFDDNAGEQDGIIDRAVDLAAFRNHGVDDGGVAADLLAGTAGVAGREKASELLETIAPERIEKIENERTVPRPDEVLTMAEKYKRPSLCNYYCSRQCPIGEQYVPQVPMRELSAIVLEMLASLNAMNKEKERLIEIAADGHISNGGAVQGLLQPLGPRAAVCVQAALFAVQHPQKEADGGHAGGIAHGNGGLVR